MKGTDGVRMAAGTASSGVTGVVLVSAIALAAAVVAVLVAVASALVVWLSLRHPFCVSAAGLSAAALVVGGPLVVAALWCLVAVGLLVWRRRWPAGFDRRVLRRWRRTFVYGWRWRRAMMACDLDRAGRLWRQVPRLGAVWSSRWTDTVSVHPLQGQSFTWFAARSEELAWMLGARRCVVRPDAGVIRLELHRGEPRGRRPVVVSRPAEGRHGGRPLGIAEDASQRVNAVPARAAPTAAAPEAPHRSSAVRSSGDIVPWIGGSATVPFVASGQPLVRRVTVVRRSRR